MKQRPLMGPVDVLLTVTESGVRLTGPGIDVSANHGGMRTGLVEAVNEVRRSRGQARRPGDERGSPVSPDDRPLRRIGQLLAESFLPEPVASELKRVLAAAERVHQLVRVGLAVPLTLTGLPWEALPSPDGNGPLALHPLVSFYRKMDAGTAQLLPGPLRIVVAIAAPDSGEGPVLDYEQELRNVLAAVRAARQSADVRVVPFATVAAIRAELDRGPAHVLHISGHGSPGILSLENHDGSARPITADELVDLAVPPGRMPTVITLAVGYSDAGSRQDGISFATRLGQRGAAAVIATQTSVDVYAAKLLARVYGTLAQASHPDAVSALAEARRQVQAELETSPDQRDSWLAQQGEWAEVTMLAATGVVPVLDQDRIAPMAEQPSRRSAGGLAARDEGYFVGRRPEQRRWPAELTGSALAGIVIHGIGGVGKTALAAEIAHRIQDGESDWILVSLAGALTLEGLLDAVITSVRRKLLVDGQGQDDGQTIRALRAAAQSNLSWLDRLAILRDHVLNRVPVLLLLDNFEDNLRPAGDARYAIRDEVLADLLAAWVSDPGRSRVLATCRYPFTLPEGAARRLSFRQLGALSRAETMKLAWSLPALDRLDENQLERVWRLAGGHPRSLEYLDALLSAGQARYPDVTERLGAAVTRRLGGVDRGEWMAARTELDAALAETVALAADDVLLDGLLVHLAQVSGAADMLLGTCVYREPVDLNAVLFQVGQPDPEAEHPPDRKFVEQAAAILAAFGIDEDDSVDIGIATGYGSRQVSRISELNQPLALPVQPVPGLPEQIAACQTAGLLTISGNGEEQRFFVHRWTAAELADRQPERLAEAHRKAARYWQWRVRAWPQDDAAIVHDLLEARHHLLQSGDSEAAVEATERACKQLHTWGAWDQEASLVHETLTQMPANSPHRAFWIRQLGLLAQERGDYDQADRQYRRALDVNERLGNRAGVADNYHQLGNVALLRGDYDQAERMYQRSLDIDERLGDNAGLAASYHNLGNVAFVRGDYDQADRLYQRALGINKLLGDEARLATSYGALGNLAKERGRYDEAASHYRRNLDISERLGDQSGMAGTYHQLGILAELHGDYDEAARLYQRSLDIKQRLGDQAGMATAYHQLGILAQLHRDYDEAARQYQRSLDIKQRLGDQAGTAGTYHQLGTLAQVRGNYDEAARLYQRSLGINERLGNQADMAGTYHQLGTLAQLRGNYDEAARLYQRSLGINERLGNQVDMANTYQQLGALEKESGGALSSAIKWQVGALLIRIRLRVPGAMSNLRYLADYRHELGREAFTRMLAQAVGNSDLTSQITQLIDQADEAKGGPPS